MGVEVICTLGNRLRSTHCRVFLLNGKWGKNRYENSEGEMEREKAAKKHQKRDKRP